MGRTGIEPTEAAFAGLLSAYGDLVVARTRGEPVEPRLGSTRALARRYRARRRAFDGLLEASGHAPGGKAGADDGAALDNMRATLEWLDELEPTPGAVPTPGGGSDEAPAIRALHTSVYRRYGLAAADLRRAG